MYFSQTVESAFSIAINSALYDEHFPPAGTPIRSLGSSVTGHSMMIPPPPASVPSVTDPSL